MNVKYRSELLHAACGVTEDQHDVVALQRIIRPLLSLHLPFQPSWVSD